MKIKNIIIFGVFIFTLNSMAQTKKWKVNFHVGPQYNFFVDYNTTVKYNDSYITPIETYYGYDLLQKKPFGTIMGIEVSYINKKNLIGISYQRSENYGLYNGEVQLQNTVFEIVDYKLRHLNNYFELNIKHNILNKNKFYWKVGLYLLNPSQDEIEIDLASNTITLYRRTGFNFANLNEIGILFGGDYIFYSNKYYELGINTTYYFTVSTSSPEAFTIYPFICLKF